MAETNSSHQQEDKSCSDLPNAGVEETASCTTDDLPGWGGGATQGGNSIAGGHTDPPVSPPSGN